MFENSLKIKSEIIKFEVSLILLNFKKYKRTKKIFFKVA